MFVKEICSRKTCHWRRLPQLETKRLGVQAMHHDLLPYPKKIITLEIDVCQRNLLQKNMPLTMYPTVRNENSGSSSHASWPTILKTIITLESEVCQRNFLQKTTPLTSSPTVRYETSRRSSHAPWPTILKTIITSESEVFQRNFLQKTMPLTTSPTVRNETSGSSTHRPRFSILKRIWNKNDRVSKTLNKKKPVGHHWLRILKMRTSR